MKLARKLAEEQGIGNEKRLLDIGGNRKTASRGVRHLKKKGFSFPEKGLSHRYWGGKGVEEDILPV